MGRWRSCCSMPHGSASITAMLVTTTAFILSRLAQTTCHYITVNLPGTVGEAGEFGFGLVSREGFFEFDNNLYRGCVYYNDFDRDNFWDATWRAAVAMGALSTAFGGISLIFIYFTGCVAFPGAIFKLVALMLLLAGTCDALTLIALSSSLCKDGDDCDFGAGAGMAIAASVVWFVSACIVMKIPEAAPDNEELMRGVPEEGQLEEQEEDAEAEAMEKAEKSDEPAAEVPEGPKTEE
mmetsp:Transcript_27031/g.39535  ORF Transcript_27031/g.39535 Transcript_27031/m.39535 type:complete len:237 (-) Transcript_27031:58-768(-)|eukprot:CAMPEP_0194032718 /NCGR_PEP_ID=MMETSP0009_2-20130614/5598_1 /TAXON_ID=210454 /ORGANISM="Grammatophora oceanica, Strain CCMP 410" /LENGTH=236 /DNA_ID=CAMNT_0038673243 /DNA_START=79 /DNA_END=789 /DNA_ORIENTATION=-